MAATIPVRGPRRVPAPPETRVAVCGVRHGCQPTGRRPLGPRRANVRTRVSVSRGRKGNDDCLDRVARGAAATRTVATHAVQGVGCARPSSFLFVLVSSAELEVTRTAEAAPEQTAATGRRDADGGDSDGAWRAPAPTASVRSTTARGGSLGPSSRPRRSSHRPSAPHHLPPPLVDHMKRKRCRP